MFREDVEYLAVTEKDKESSDFISLDQAPKQILLQTGRAVHIRQRYIGLLKIMLVINCLAIGDGGL